MKGNLELTAYIGHIQDAIKKIEDYAGKTSHEAFLKNDWDQDAVIRNLEIIGEALNHIDPQVREVHPTIPWRKIIALRNTLIHAYFGVDLELVWKIVEKDIPELKREIKVFVNERSTMFEDKPINE